jgi:toxin-antitoxin system PIN domain toxin
MSFTTRSFKSPVMNRQRRGLDTNVLIYAQIPSLPDHEVVRRYLLEQLKHEEVTLAVTPTVLHEFIHVVTDGRRFEPPISMSEAIAVTRLYLGRSNINCLAINEAVLQDTLALLERHGLGRKRVADTLLAATLLHYGIDEIITCNPRDFEPFEGLRIIDPRASV